MANLTETSDGAILDLLRLSGATSVSALAAETGVTATAVRQRLNRLMGQGLIKRGLERSARGRPSHKYSLTDKGRREAGDNYGDLALMLWKEIRSVKDPEVRRGLLQRMAGSIAKTYADRVYGDTLRQRMESLGEIMSERNVPFEVDDSGRLPVLTALACPYPDLAEQDRGVCAMERMMISEVLGEGVRLSECRLDGSNCCTFEVA